MGQFDYLPSNEDLDTKCRATQYINDWSITGEQSGSTTVNENQDSFIINVIGMVNNGELKFIVMSKLNQKFLERFIAEFKNILEQITQL